MHEFLTAMNNPQIVADFQKVFGLEWEFDQNNNDNTVKDQNVTEQPNCSKKLTKNAQDPTVSSSQEHMITNTDHTHIVTKTKINIKFWYYFFHVGAALGNEIFYSFFFPIWYWNIDGAIARKITVVWGIYMYIGQATKDLMCMPRPASPPVVKLEKRYVLEYGFPSTHAMVACGLPISLVLLSYGRYNIDGPVLFSMALTFCLWVCCSRMYLGMHSLLDVSAGVLYGLVILVVVMPLLEPIDYLIMNYESAPFVLFPLGLIICYLYPKVKRWSTTRSDTAIVIGTVVGFTIGSALNNYIGLLIKPDTPPLYDIHYPDTHGMFNVVIRTFFGMTVLLLTRQTIKPIFKKILCTIFFQDPTNIENMRKKRIEIPLNYLTYLFLGFNVTFTSPYVFHLLNIERDYSYTEL